MTDSLAYHNKLRWIDPALKFILAMSVVLICLLSTRPFVGLVAMGWMFLWIAILYGGLPVQLALLSFLVVA